MRTLLVVVLLQLPGISFSQVVVSSGIKYVVNPETGAMVELSEQSLRIISTCIVQSAGDRTLYALNPEKKGGMVELKAQNVRVLDGCIVKSLGDGALYVVNPKTGALATVSDQGIVVK